jgi:hypothetical protein
LSRRCSAAPTPCTTCSFPGGRARRESISISADDERRPGAAMALFDVFFFVKNPSSVLAIVITGRTLLVFFARAFGSRSVGRYRERHEVNGVSCSLGSSDIECRLLRVDPGPSLFPRPRSRAPRKRVGDPRGSSGRRRLPLLRATRLRRCASRQKPKLNMGSFQSNKMEKKSDIRLSAPPDFLESHTKRRFLRFVLETHASRSARRQRSPEISTAPHLASHVSCGARARLGHAAKSARGAREAGVARAVGTRRGVAR